MALIRTSKRPTTAEKRRYPNKDEQNSWIVKGTSGKPIVHKWDRKKPPATFTSNVYTEVEAAARSYTQETGLFAQPVRA